MDRFKLAEVISETCVHADGLCTADQHKRSVVPEPVCVAAVAAYNARIDDEIARLQSIDPQAEIQLLLDSKK